MGTNGSDFERKLKRLEREFETVRTRRTPSFILKKLSGGGSVNAVKSRQVAQESQTHSRHTRKLLDLIDRYATVHASGVGRQIRLPSAMIRELERLAVRPSVRFHPKLKRTVAQALRAHQNRLYNIFQRAEEIRVKHGIGVAMGVARKLAA